MNRKNSIPPLHSLLRQRPAAYAVLSGGASYPSLYGTVRFFETSGGMLVAASFEGLPSSDGIYAFHVHSGTDCKAPLSHYNPTDAPHPYHAGDLPPIFSAGGSALSVFLTSRFRLSEVRGKTVILHAGPDDFKTQPSGDPGEPIACGIIL